MISCEVNFKRLWITITIVYIHPFNGCQDLNSSTKRPAIDANGNMITSSPTHTRARTHTHTQTHTHIYIYRLSCLEVGRIFRWVSTHQRTILILVYLWSHLFCRLLQGVWLHTQKENGANTSRLQPPQRNCHSYNDTICSLEDILEVMDYRGSGRSMLAEDDDICDILTLNK